MTKTRSIIIFIILSLSLNSYVRFPKSDRIVFAYWGNDYIYVHYANLEYILFIDKSAKKELEEFAKYKTGKYKRLNYDIRFMPIKRPFMVLYLTKAEMNLMKINLTVGSQVLANKGFGITLIFKPKQLWFVQFTNKQILFIMYNKFTIQVIKGGKNYVGINDKIVTFTVSRKNFKIFLDWITGKREVKK